MPKGPSGEKRPADAVGLAVLVGRIAVGDVEDSRDDTAANREAVREVRHFGGRPVGRALMRQVIGEFGKTESRGKPVS